MRSVTISKEDFDQIVYPAVSQVPMSQVYSEPSTQQNLRRVLWKLLDKLEKPAKAVSDDAMTLYVLDSDSCQFDLDDREADVLLAYLRTISASIAPARARRLEPLMVRCEKGDPDENGISSGTEESA